MNLPYLFLQIIFLISTEQKDPNLNGTWELVGHSYVDEYGYQIKHTYSNNGAYLSMTLEKKDSIVTVCGNGGPATFFGHFTVDKNNNVKLKGFGDDRLMMLPSGIEFTRKASQIDKLYIHKDKLQFDLKSKSEKYIFTRVDTSNKRFQKCDIYFEMFK
jgi:hypothetical protein